MVQFERAHTEDAPELLPVKIRAFQWDVETYGMGPPGYDDLEDLKKAISDALYYKIMDKGKIIGGLSLYPRGENHFELGSIYVDPECQNSGVGAKAIAFMEKAYPQIRKWTLDTPYLSFRNHHFYEKMGYRKIGEKRIEALNDFCLFLYEKNL